MTMNRIAVTALILLLPLSLLSAQELVTVRTGHIESVHDVAGLNGGERVFTGGQDGKVMVWDPETDRLLQSIHADVLPIEKLVPFSDDRRVAVYSSNGERHHITVWDWRTGERLFLHTPQDEVLHMDVSSQGTYLVYSVPRLRSVQILDGRSGRQLPFLRQNTGIVSWFVIARSEERVMTYAPGNGAIVYRNIVTGSEAGRFSAQPDLSHLSLLTTTRFAAGRLSNGTLGVLDLLSGEVVAETAAGEIEVIQTDRADGDIVVVSRDILGEPLIRRYRFSGGSLQRRFTTRREIPPGITAYYIHGRDIFAGDDSGRFLRWLPFEVRPTIMNRQVVEPVNDFLLQQDTLHLLGTDQVVSIRSDFFNPEIPIESTRYAGGRFTRIDASTAGRFISDGDWLHLIWLPEQRNLTLREFHPDTVSVVPSPLNPPDSLTGVDIHDGSVLFRDRSGRVTIQDAVTGEETFSYRGRSIQTASLTSRGVFIGTAAGGIFNSSVLRVDTRTSETVPLDTSTDLVFFIDYDERRGRLFTIGVYTDQSGALSTVVEVFEGASFQRRRRIIEIDGEYLEAMLVIDPVTGNAYTTLDDRGGILRWDGTNTSEVRRNPAHIPYRIALNGNYLYTLNRDGTVSIYDRFAGEPILDIYAIAGSGLGSWIALRPDGTYVVSRDYLASLRYLSVNDVERDVESLRINIPAQEPLRATPTRPGGSDPASPGHRFDSGRDDSEDRRPRFDPFSGEPAPSS